MKSKTLKSSNSAQQLKPLISKHAYQLAKTIGTPQTDTLAVDLDGTTTTNGNATTTQPMNPFGSSNLNLQLPLSLRQGSGHGPTGSNPINTWLDADSALAKDSLREKSLEYDIMGSIRTKSDSQKSKAMEQNVENMFNLLRSRLTNLKDKISQEFVHAGEDVRIANAQGEKNSLLKEEKDSKSGKTEAELIQMRKLKIVDETDEELPKLMRDVKVSTSKLFNFTAI
jgi:hypothetical protein